MQLKSHPEGKILAGKLELAERFFQRLRGLIGRTEISNDTALLIRNCRMVHTFFLKFPIDIVFCSEKGTVVLVQENLVPWKISKLAYQASYVIEFRQGTVKEKQIRVGDQVYSSPEAKS